jgi:hypothetical protein
MMRASSRVVETGEKKRADRHYSSGVLDTVKEKKVEEEEVREKKAAAAVTSPAVVPSSPVVSEPMDTKDDDTTAAKPAVAAPAAPSTPTEASATASPAAPEKPKPVYCPNSVIMFDWDDTLLASSFLSARGYRVDAASEPPSTADAGDAAQLRALEQCVCSLLTLAMQYGRVNIVTNAETGWVELSAQKFIPAVVPLLQHVTVVSARSTYEPAHPEAPLKWKFYAFHERLRAAFGAGCMDSRVPEGAPLDTVTEMRHNIVSFGDSHVEREAIRAVTRGVVGWKTKSVKFAERPTVEQLRRQLELVTNCFHYIATHQSDLDLQLTVTLHTTPPPQPVVA